jgi:hypothetical protein
VIGFDVTDAQRGDRNAPDPANNALGLAHDPVNALNAAPSKADADAWLLSTFNAWWTEARDAHAANRAEQHKDAAFYDHKQWEPEAARILIERGQAPLTYNLIKPAVDWVIGTERRTRVDWKIHPRGPEDEKLATVKQQTVKYVDDVNNGSFARSAAFSHQVKVGIGWVEECVRTMGDEEPICFRHEDWKAMWWDPFARELDLRDARYMTRSKFMDVDYAIAMWPHAAGALVQNARAADDLDLDDNENPQDIPGLWFDTTSHSHSQETTHHHNGAGGGTFGLGRRQRSRVRILETWYRKPMRVKVLRSLDMALDRAVYDPKLASHAEALTIGRAQTVDRVVDRMCVAIWIPSLLLKTQETPYKHNRFPFTPFIAYRDDANGLPYGLIRGMRDAQSDYNKRRGKALYVLSVNRLLYEASAIDEADENAFLDEANQPDAQLRLKDGALKEKRVQFESGLQIADAHLKMMEQDQFHIFEGNGITRENLGQNSNAISGRAILAKQQQGAVTTAELFDNYRFGFRISGQKLLSITEQFMTLPKRIRIVGPGGAYKWLQINEPAFDEATGEVFFHNDITKSEADFYVDQQDYRETVRMAMAESLFETMKGLDPTLQLQLFDLAIELTDIPNREEFARRIRELNGQTAPGEEASPEQQAQKQAQEQAKAEEAALAKRAREARAGKDESAALKNTMDAVQSNVAGKVAAIQGAQVLAGAVPFAPTADRLAEFPQPQVTG